MMPLTTTLCCRKGVDSLLKVLCLIEMGQQRCDSGVLVSILSNPAKHQDHKPLLIARSLGLATEQIASYNQFNNKSAIPHSADVQAGNGRGKK